MSFHEDSVELCAFSLPADSYAVRPASQDGRNDEIIREVIQMQECYSDSLTESMNNGTFDYHALVAQFFAPEYAEISNLQPGDLDSMQATLELLSKTIGNEGGWMTPIKTRYPSCQVLDSSLVVVFVVGEFEILLPDGSHFTADIRSNNVIRKMDGRWLFLNSCNQNRLAVARGARSPADIFLP